MLQNQIAQLQNCRWSKKHINDNVWRFLGFLHSNVVDSPTCIVLLSSNRNRVVSTSQDMCSCRGLIGMRARIGATIGKMPFLSKSIALPFSLHWVLNNLSPLNILIPSSRGWEPCSPSLENSQSPKPPKHRLVHHSGHSGNSLASSQQYQLHAEHSETVEWTWWHTHSQIWTPISGP
jgi:hypothetical protein